MSKYLSADSSLSILIACPLAVGASIYSVASHDPPVKSGLDAIPNWSCAAVKVLTIIFLSFVQSQPSHVTIAVSGFPFQISAPLP
jgi:hypothetical protein